MDRLRETILILGLTLFVIATIFILLGATASAVDVVNNYPSDEGDDYSEWNGASNAYSDDGSNTQFTDVLEDQDYYSFGFNFDIYDYFYLSYINLSVDFVDQGIDGSSDYLNYYLSWDMGDTYTSVQYWTLSTGNDVYYDNESGGNAFGHWWSKDEFNDSNFQVYLKSDIGFREQSGLDYVKVEIGYTAYNISEKQDDDFGWKMLFYNNADNDSSIRLGDLYMLVNGTSTNIWEHTNKTGSRLIRSISVWDYVEQTYVPGIVGGPPDFWRQYLDNCTSAFFIDLNITAGCQEWYNSSNLVCSNTSYDNLDGYANLTNSFGDWVNLSFDIDVSDDPTPIVNVDNVTESSIYLYDSSTSFTKSNSYGSITLQRGINFVFNTGQASGTGSIVESSDLQFDNLYENFTDVGCGYYLNHSWNAQYKNSVYSDDTHSQIDNVSCNVDYSGSDYYNFSDIGCDFFLNHSWSWSITDGVYSSMSHLEVDNVSCGGGDPCVYPWYYNFTILEGKADVNITVTSCGEANNSTTATKDDFIYMAGLDMEPNLMAFVLMVLFFIYGLAYSDYGYVLMVFASIMAFSLGFYYVLLEAEATTVTYWLGVIFFMFSIFCGFLALYLGLNFGRGRSKL